MTGKDARASDPVSWAYGWAAGRMGIEGTGSQISSWINVPEFERGRCDGEGESPFIVKNIRKNFKC